MAYLPTDEEELQKQQTSAAQTSGQASVLGGKSASPAQAGATATGSGYVNLNKYLAANDQQGAGLAGVVTDGAGKSVEAAKTNAISWGDTAKANVNKGVVSVDQGLINQIRNDPTQVGQTYSAYQSKQYAGPQDGTADTGYTDILGQFSRAGEQVSKVGDRNTQKSILQDSAKTNPNSLGLQQGQRYTNGFGNLDSFILNGDKAGQQTLGAFQAKNAGFQSALDDQVGSINQSIAQAKAQSDANKNQVRQAVLDTRNQTYAGIDAQIGDRSKALQVQAQLDAQAQMDKLFKNYGSDENLLRQEVVPSGIAGQDPFVTQNGAVSRGAVMTPQERARLQALASLEAADVEAPSSNPYSFDNIRFQNEIQQASARIAAQKAAALANKPAPGPAAKEDNRTTAQRTVDNWTPSAPKKPW